MSVGQVHRLALAATAILPVLGLLSGSQLLLFSGATLIAVVALALPGLHQHPRTRPRLLWVHGATLLGLFFALVTFPRAQIDAGLMIVMLGLGNRLLLRAGQRDDFIVVGSSGVLLAAATIITPGFTFALLVLAFVPAALWSMLSASILSLSESERDAPRRQAAFLRLAARRVPPLGGSLTGWGIALMLVGYLSVSFLPRFRFGHHLLSPGGFISFGKAGSSMTLGTGGVRSARGGSVVVRVSPPEGGSPVDLEGIYARIYSLDDFDGREFRDSGGRIRLYPEARATTNDMQGCSRVHLLRLVDRGEPHPVAVVGRTGLTTVRLRRPQRRSSGTWLTFVPQATVDIRYHACPSEPAPADLPTRPDVRQQTLARFTALPKNLDPRVRALGERLAEGATTDQERIQRVLRHFARDFRYTLDPIEGQSEDPIARFLFEARAGHCELYAGAVAVLLRLAGVPARVAAGYYGGWFNQRSQQLELGSEDAHAWVEVLVGDRWRWVDATPTDARARRSHKRLAWLRDVWDALEAFWYENVIDFDDERRKAVIAQLGSSLGEGQNLVVRMLTQIRREGDALGIARGLLPLVLAVALVGVWLLFGRTGRGLTRAGRRLRQRLGGHEEPHLPLGMLVERAPSSLQPAARRAVDCYEAMRFGDSSHRPGLRAVNRAIADLEKAFRGSSQRASDRRASPADQASSSG